jgi:hypothetical protein
MAGYSFGADGATSNDPVRAPITAAFNRRRIVASSATDTRAVKLVDHLVRIFSLVRGAFWYEAR